MQVAFCTVLFSPAARLVTYHTFKQQFDRLGLPLFVAELSFDGSFESHRLGLKEIGDDRNVLWQKEALLNKLVRSLPPEYDAVAFIDCDMVWPDEKWLEEGKKKLKHANAVQLFEKTLYFDKNGGIDRAAYGWASHKEQNNPGGAWLVRRELFPLIDYMVVGGGDRVMAHGWEGTPLTRTEGFQHNWPLLNRLKVDMQRQHEKCEGKIDFVDTPNFHLYHGEMATRRYKDRMFALGDYWFNPDTDITREHGMLAWTPDSSPKLRGYVADYFKGRA